MKTTINKAEEIEKEIDFSKVQLLTIDAGATVEMVVLVSGDSNITQFWGVIVDIATETPTLRQGVYTSFQKSQFKKLPSNQSITLQND